MSISKSAKNKDSNVVIEGKDGSVLAFRNRVLRSPLGLFIINRLVKNRDVKILITSNGNTTGTGKSTLAMRFARDIFSWSKILFNRFDSWSADEYAFMDTNEYIRKYVYGQQGDVLIADELEKMADRRRSNSTGNVLFSQVWQQLRFKNIVTLGTAPGLWDLDRRILRNTDIWINVMRPGVAYVYFFTVNQHGDYMHPRFKFGDFKLKLLWTPAENDSDYETLKDMKKDDSLSFLKGIVTEKDVKDAEKDILETVAENILLWTYKDDRIDANQGEIADNLLNGERSQQWVSKKKKELEKSGKL